MRRLLLLPFLLAALTVGCSGDEIAPEAAVAEAATKTEEAGSSRVSFSMESSGAGLPGTIAVSGEGVFDYESQTGRLTYDMGDLFGGVEGDFEIVSRGLVLYIKFPEAANVPLPRGKEWIEVDLNEAGKQQGFNLAQLSQLNQGDPTQVLRYLRGASDEIEKVGEEDVRGAETTHYRATVDLKKSVEASLDRIPADQRDAVRESVDRVIALTGTGSMPVEVWIDGKGLARRFSMAWDMKVPERSDRMQLEMTMEFYDFGVEVDAQAPPQEQTVDLLELVAAEN